LLIRSSTFRWKCADLQSDVFKDVEPKCELLVSIRLRHLFIFFTKKKIGERRAGVVSMEQLFLENEQAEGMW